MVFNKCQKCNTPTQVRIGVKDKWYCPKCAKPLRVKEIKRITDSHKAYTAKKVEE